MTAVMSRLTNEWLAVALLAVPFLASNAATSASAPAPPLQLQSIADIPLGGNPTRLDYASLDVGRHLLFIAHLGDSEVIAFDTEARRVVKRIANVSHVHGVLAIPELGRVYASATGTNEERIFERFWRGRGVTRQGAGLGLAIVAEIAKAHGGSIEVSDRPGGGALFTLRIPLA